MSRFFVSTDSETVAQSEPEPEMVDGHFLTSSAELEELDTNSELVTAPSHDEGDDSINVNALLYSPKSKRPENMRSKSFNDTSSSRDSSFDALLEDESSSAASPAHKKTYKKSLDYSKIHSDYQTAVDKLIFQEFDIHRSSGSSSSSSSHRPSAHKISISSSPTSSLVNSTVPTRYSSRPISPLIYASPETVKSGQTKPQTSPLVGTALMPPALALDTHLATCVTALRANSPGKERAQTCPATLPPLATQTSSSSLHVPLSPQLSRSRSLISTQQSFNSSQEESPWVEGHFMPVLTRTSSSSQQQVCTKTGLDKTRKSHSHYAKFLDGSNVLDEQGSDGTVVDQIIKQVQERHLTACVAIVRGRKGEFSKKSHLEKPLENCEKKLFQR